MTKRPFLPLALVPALLLGGCMGTQNRGVESVHQPVVSRIDYALDLQTAGDALAPGERERLAGWLGTMHAGYGDQISVDDPAAQRGAHDDVARTVAMFGLLLGDDSPVTAAAVTAGTVRVVVSRMRAEVPGCPDYTRDSSHEFDSNTSSNYGCGINRNLAAMVARPEDLVHGVGAAGADTARSFKAIDAFRKAAPSGSGGGTVQSAGTK